MKGKIFYLSVHNKKSIHLKCIDFYYYIHSTKVSSKHLSEHTQFRLIVKNEFVAMNGKVVVGSVFGVKTRHVAQQPSNFSNLNTEDVTVSVGLLLIGIVT